MEQIQMVDLKGQYDKIKAEVDTAIQSVISTSAFIKGPAVKDFQEALSKYHNGSLVQACGNGTDALQLALMALSLQAGDEIITPAFTYFATVEVLLLLGLKPVFVDVDPTLSILMYLRSKRLSQQKLKPSCLYTYSDKLQIWRS
jgi:UDP-2-acetamido-2-deoxy-ribo-hexuluronate aminotransferase